MVALMAEITGASYRDLVVVGGCRGLNRCVVGPTVVVVYWCGRGNLLVVVGCRVVVLVVVWLNRCGRWPDCGCGRAGCGRVDVVCGSCRMVVVVVAVVVVVLNRCVG